MKMSKRLLIGVIGLSLSLSAVAGSFKDEVLKSVFVEPAKVMQLKATPELTVKPAESLTVFIYHDNAKNIMITDYGGDIEIQVNSNKLAYLESNVLVVNFAKVQNQNFERMAS